MFKNSSFLRGGVLYECRENAFLYLSYPQKTRNFKCFNEKNGDWKYYTA